MSVLRQLGPQRATRCPSSQVSVGRLVSFQHARRDLRNCAVDQRLTSTAPSAPGLRPVPWTDAPSQIKALATLTQRFSKELASKEVDEDTLKWFLRDRYFDPVEAEEKLRKTLQWRQTFKPQATTPAMLAAELASGKAYVHTAPDKYGRPAIVIRTRLHKTGQFPITDSKRLAAHMIDTALAQLPPGGEQIVGIFDLRGFEFTTNADFQFAAFMVEAFFEYYPRRVGQVLMVEAPWVFFPAWEVIKPLMRKYAALVSFVSVADVRRDYFTPQSLPDDFK
ncbi:hypothetical protein HYH03_006457 [Edaphochlamys debaryana]|uniref:CRAL-TRIO domain-containing protein n=1 Tax=Edaphochlamys debaryana TaxID=47281 RepID=A0A835YDG0_9CHLO|nr:hypothetical protein HYH03_006457 [Edaphochlamys debaryana]|eukprot:KAG2495514.1 hypothetical protein HYH03_006457 [Edaphochlamys debaryana]